jgi:hypothetical protein
MERNSTPSKGKEKIRKKGKSLTMPVILRKNTSKQKLLWVFNSLHVCATPFYEYNHKSRGIIFNYKCWTAAIEATVGCFEKVPLIML